MKLRQGFVSNSSSSSFVIMAPTHTETCDHCGRSDPNLFKTLRGLSQLHANMDGETGVRSKEETLELLTEWFEDEDGDVKLLIAKAMVLVQEPPEGWEVRLVDIGHHDSAAEYLMDNSKYAYKLMDDDIWDPEAVDAAVKLKEITK